MPHDKLKTFEEISEELNLTVRQLQGIFYAKKATFTTSHTTKIISPALRKRGDNMLRVFTDLGVKRIMFLSQGLQDKTTAVPVTAISTQKYPLIEKISHPKIVEPLAATHDDEVLDIAVKIIAERTAFNKIKEEITVLREQNARMKSLLMCISNDIDGGLQL
jgi:hypothetical protein